MKSFPRVEILEKSVKIRHLYDEAIFIELDWDEEDSWEDISRRNKIYMYDRFHDFMECPEHFSPYKFPYSVMVYYTEFFYMISSCEIVDFEDIENCFLLNKNRFDLYNFYREFLIPFTHLDNYDER